AYGTRHRPHHRGRESGGNARKRSRLKATAARPMRPKTAYAVLPPLERRSGLLELQQQRVEMLGPRSAHQAIPAGDRAGDQKGSRLDPIPNHLVFNAVKLGHTLDTDDRRAGTVDVSAHLAER